jgi:predicted secreted hydrolase
MKTNQRIVVGLLIVVMLAVGGYLLWQASLPEVPVAAEVSLNATLGSTDTTGYARAVAPRPFQFPADHGSHPDYRTEWWYFTGNVSTPEGRPFGFQLTFFRQALAAQAATRASDWSTRQVMLAHFALSDISAARFHADERLVRAAGGLGGATLSPFRVWVDEWAMSAAHPEQVGFWPLRLRASQPGIQLDLLVDSLKPLVLQGERGLSRKSSNPGNASYYYSYPRLRTTGTITTAEGTFPVMGLSWFDREWSTSALAADQVGWDWFSLQPDDQTELMLYQLRRADGAADPASSGSVVSRAGGVTTLMNKDFSIEVLDHWTHPRSGIKYPSRWRLKVQREQLDVVVTPRLADQELPLQVRYWEGSVAVEGTRAGKPISGLGYTELTGYTLPR